jgi:hypothetical protein
MTQELRGGEPDGVRLLELARRELLQVLLPQLQGEHRYRARLIANAMKIAARELQGDEAEESNTALRRLAAALPEGVDGAAIADAEIAAALAAALRAGCLDGDPDLHAALLRLTEERGAKLR